MMLRAGIVAGGFIAEVHARAIRSARGVPAAIVSSSPAAGRRAGERLGIEHVCESLDAMLADPDIDVVHVGTPNASHAELVRDVIAACKHVICESRPA